VNFLCTILGVRRQGKSTLALAVACARSKSIIVFDPNRQYTSLPWSGVDPEVIENALSEDEFLLVVRPDAATLVEDWHILAETLWSWHDYALVIDEASELQTAGWRDEWLDRYIRQAPDDVSLIMTTHRAVDLAKLSRALSSDLFVFRTRQESDLKVLESEFPEIRTDVIRDLPMYHVLHYWVDYGGIGRNNLWDKPREWYIDITGKREREGENCRAFIDQRELAIAG